MPYLFAHFREKLTIDGEQVYFALSRDGYNWESVNDGEPIITCTKGEFGCRDIEIVRLHTGGFVILATDLCIVNRMYENYNVDWKKVN
ncbi:MAG: 1,4-beta-xylanase, partial [Eubacterium sp.]|nr:1,4-beta-xylanase [Eubacterium sp.]